MSDPPAGPLSERSASIGARADVAATAKLRTLGGRTVAWFSVAGGKHHGAIGLAGATTVTRLVRHAIDLRVPVVGVLDTSGAEFREGVTALHAWGGIARAMADASGVVPTVLSVTGACVSGPARLLGMADAVVMTRDSFAYVSGPEAVRDFTGVDVSREALGGAAVHDARTGVATLLADDDRDAADAVELLLSYLPDHHLADTPRIASGDPVDRPCTAAARAVPSRATASYDVRDVLDDVLDSGSVLELRAAYANNLVTALGRLDGRAVGIVANQPCRRAGTLDIEASMKAARFVTWCDSFNLPIITFVDTPGFEPGRDLEWRGMIRHGAELVHAYAAATVPRLCVVLRKAYGGAYIVMDSRGVGNDLCVAWPTAEIAVMGAAGAVRILHGRRLAESGTAEGEAELAALAASYDEAFANPYRAAERGYVDSVIEPHDTRRVLAGSLEVLATKRDRQPARRHASSPL